MLELIERPDPTAGRGQVVVEVAASTVSWIDVSARAGRLAQGGLVPDGVALELGWDVAGRVVEAGPGVRRLAAGDDVIGLRDLLTAPGTNADAVVLDVSAVAASPNGLSSAEAATLPLNGTTAVQSLDLCGLRSGDSLLVTGAAGGVGGFVLQLAALRGIRTVGLCRPTDVEFVTGLGAAAVTSPQHVADDVRSLFPGGVDAVIDAANLAVLAHAALRSTGMFVALVRPFAPPPLRGTRVHVVEAYADSGTLGQVAALAESGQLSPRVAHVFALDDIQAAHRAMEGGSLRGKVVLESR